MGSTGTGKFGTYDNSENIFKDIDSMMLFLIYNFPQFI